MDIYSVIKFVGGLASFLYGMKVMSDGLEKSSSGKIDKYLKYRNSEDVSNGSKQDFIAEKICQNRRIYF